MMMYSTYDDYIPFPNAIEMDVSEYEHSAHLPAPASTEPHAVTRRLLVDNRDRVSGSPFDYQVLFGNTFRANSVGVSEYRNVSSIELKLLAFPKIANEAYVVVDIAELNSDSNLDATNSVGHAAFAVGFFDTSQLAPGDVKPIRDFYSQKVVFNPPRVVDKLSVRCLTHDGNVVQTGASTGNSNNMSMLLEVTAITG